MLRCGLSNKLNSIIETVYCSRVHEGHVDVFKLFLTFGDLVLERNGKVFFDLDSNLLANLQGYFALDLFLNMITTRKRS